MKTQLKLLLLFGMVGWLSACSQSTPAETAGTVENTTVIETPGDIKAGGLYYTPNEDGTFSACKVLAVDPFAVHLRLYANVFEIKPQSISSDTLEIGVGHVPLSIEGFKDWDAEFVKQEKVREEELEGYKMYLKAMGQ